jgi:hypothetical protein
MDDCEDMLLELEVCEALVDCKGAKAGRAEADWLRGVDMSSSVTWLFGRS